MTMVVTIHSPGRPWVTHIEAHARLTWRFVDTCWGKCTPDFIKTPDLAFPCWQWIVPQFVFYVDISRIDYVDSSARSFFVTDLRLFGADQYPSTTCIWVRKGDKGRTIVHSGLGLSFELSCPRNYNKNHRVVSGTNPTCPRDMYIERNYTVTFRDFEYYNLEPVMRLVLLWIFHHAGCLPGSVAKHWAIALGGVALMLMVKITPVVGVNNRMLCSEEVRFTIHLHRTV